MFLETRAKVTLDALLKVDGVEASRCVVPNLSKSECEAIPALCLPTTSHILISGLAASREAQDKHRALLEKQGWCGKFAIVFLDFCGTFDSKPGRARRKDIARLFRCSMLEDCSILACTFSQRGTPLCYASEAVDSVCLFVEGMAKQHGYAATCLGVASYPNYGNKFSSKDPKSTATGQVHTALFAIGSSALEARSTLPKRPPDAFSDLPGAAYFPGPWTKVGAWSLSQDPLPLHNALSFCARRFAEQVCAYASPHRALALEGNPFIFCRQLAGAANSIVDVVATNPLCEIFASRIENDQIVLKSSTVAVHETQDPTSHRFNGFATRLERDWLSIMLRAHPSCYDAIFLDYSARTVPLLRVQEYAQGNDEH